jgi:hypothetical protein
MARTAVSDHTADRRSRRHPDPTIRPAVARPRPAAPTSAVPPPAASERGAR